MSYYGVTHIAIIISSSGERTILSAAREPTYPVSPAPGEPGQGGGGCQGMRDTRQWQSGGEAGCRKCEAFMHLLFAGEKIIRTSQKYLHIFPPSPFF